VFQPNDRGPLSIEVDFGFHQHPDPQKVIFILKSLGGGDVGPVQRKTYRAPSIRSETGV
jgi:hypothetical protein